MKFSSRWFHAALVVVAVLFIPAASSAQGSLDSVLTPYLSKYELPALAAAVVQDGKVVAAGAVGTRRVGTKTPVTLDDRFHIGSDTKAMTALLAAMLVEEGKLRWDTAVLEVFPELAPTMDARLKRVTLEQLLSHTSGLSGDTEELANTLYAGAMAQEGNLDEMRYWMVQQWCKRPLEADPGTKWAYSNLGFTFVAAIIERTAGKTWEELVTERVFSPLDMHTAGLGPQSSPGKVDAPLGHALVGGKAKAFLAGPNGDVLPVIGPAGNAHMSVLDFARWAGWNAGEGKRKPFLVKPETLRRLHTPVVTLPERKDAPPGTPPGGKYALGWGQVAEEWAPLPLVYHGGSNGMNLAHVWLDTRRDFAMVLMTNVGGEKANLAFMALEKELYTSFAKKKGAK